MTTEKDAVRMQGDDQMAELATRIKVLPVSLEPRRASSIHDAVARKGRAGADDQKDLALEPVGEMALQHGFR